MPETGLLAYFKGIGAQGIKEPRAQKLAEYIGSINSELTADWTRRVYGDGTYSGYQVLRDFYKGKQWSFKKEAGGTMRTYNYTFTIVENMVAFLTNEPPQISCPPRQMNDPVQRALAEARTKLLNAVHDDNSISLVFQKAARTASITGDCFVFGAIPTFKVDDDGVKKFDRIRYWNIEKPETIRVIWKDDNYGEMAGFIKQYRLGIETAKRLFAEEIKEAGVVVSPDQDVDNPSNIGGNITTTQVPMMTVKEYWDENEYLLMFGNSNVPVHYVKHGWGFIPLNWIPNIHLPGESKGTSDIEHELDPQQEYNERASDLADIIKEVARPTYWGKNIDNVSEIRSGQIVIYSVGDDGELNAMPKSGNTPAVEQYLADRRNDIINLSGMNQVLYPGNNVLQATGRALSVVMQGVNNKISNRKEWWVQAFKNINRSILFHVENHVTGARPLIDGFYTTDVFIASVLLRSVTDEINKFNAKIQSLTTTQKNVGIPNPSEEQKLMTEELQDPILSVEISKQPGLLHQVLAEKIAAATQAAQAGQGNAGAPGVGAGGAPNAAGGGAIGNEGDNQGNLPAPASAPGVASRVSPGGAARQAASRRGAPAQVAGRK